jgi:hypothetical protein
MGVMVMGRSLTWISALLAALRPKFYDWTKIINVMFHYTNMISKVSNFNYLLKFGKAWLIFFNLSKLHME